jgi:hypothetical protein
MEKKHGGNGTKERSDSETSLFASNLSSSDSKAIEVIERQCGGKATQVANGKAV